MIKASVIISTYNMGHYIKKMIMSLLSQSEQNFELIIVDDNSTDDTKKIVLSIKNPRIKYLYNSQNLGKSLSRNKGIQIAKGKYLFFTDADCTVNENWLEEGLKSFKNDNCVGIEGKIYYVSEQYKPTYADRVVQNLSGGEYMTANAAYKKDVLIQANFFNPLFERNQDRDLALKIMKFGKIKFNPKMLVYHSPSLWNPYEYMTSASWVYYRVILLYKIHQEKHNMFFRIYEPKKLLSIIFPPLILLKLFMDNYKSKNDYLFFLLVYPRLVYERVLLWKYSIKEKVFII